MIDTPYLALLHAFKRMRILHGLDKFSIFQEYKEWIFDDYKCNSIIFIKEEHNIQSLNMIFSEKIYFINIHNSEFYLQKNLQVLLKISYKLLVNKFKSPKTS